MRWRWLGRTPYDRAALLQETLREAVWRGDEPDTLLLCEHDPVITLGRGAGHGNVLISERELARRGLPLLRSSRGGDVTYHGPGQLVGYPVFKLRRGVVDHMESMAAAVAAVLGQVLDPVLAPLGIRAEWRRREPGLWVGQDKICAFGVHVRHKVAIHGFALNVNVDPAAFSVIVPCGLRGVGVTSIARLVGSSPPLPDLAARVALAFPRAFGFGARDRDLDCKTERGIYKIKLA